VPAPGPCSQWLSPRLRHWRLLLQPHVWSDHRWATAPNWPQGLGPPQSKAPAALLKSGVASASRCRNRYVSHTSHSVN
jgi:hypothetical protein